LAEKKDLQKQLNVLQIKLDIVHQDILRELKEAQVLQIKAHQEDLNHTIDEIKQSIVEEKRSLRLFYYGIFLGLLGGVLGNFFVSFMFQESTSENIVGLVITGLMTFATLIALWFKARK
jgi:hypothetical protein